jgi:uroporphyrinogen-III decarboxylase
MRCNLNISVVGPWWEKQLGLPGGANAEEKQAALRRVFPDLITFRNESVAHPVADPNHGFTMLKALGVEVAMGDNGVPTFTQLAPEQVLRLSPPDYATSPAVASLRQAIRETRRQHGSAVNTSFSGLLFQAMKVRGQDIFTDFYEFPEMLHHLMSVLGETLYRHLCFLKDECGSIPYFVLGSCSNCMISPALYDEFLRPHEARVSTLSNYLMGHPRAMGMHHCGTKADAYFPVYAKIPELEMIEASWDTDMDLGRRVMPGLLFKPMLDPIRLDQMTEDAIAAQLSSLLEHPAVIEVQAFDLSQFCTIAKVRRMLTVTLEYNHRLGLPGYTRFFV